MALGSSFFFLAAALARSFSFLQERTRTAGAGQQRAPMGPPRRRTGRQAAGRRLRRPSSGLHSHALVTQADHALHHRILPRLLLLSL